VAAVVPSTRGTRRFRPLDRRETTRLRATVGFFLSGRSRFGLRRGGGRCDRFLFGTARIFFGLFAYLLFGPAVFLRAAALFLGRLLRLAILAPARLLQRGHARLFRLAEKFFLKLLAGGGVRYRTGRLCVGLRLRCLCGRRRCGLGLRRLFHLRRIRFTRLAQNPALLHLHHDGVGSAMTEALLHLARFHRALQAQRRARSQLRLICRLAHTILRSHPQPTHPAYPPSRRLAHHWVR
jgi:hypothetical protein